jgi:hypothetical protein
VSEPIVIPPDNRCHTLMVLEGLIQTGNGEGSHQFERGRTVLLPASSLPQAVAPIGRSVFLQVYWD